MTILYIRDYAGQPSVIAGEDAHYILNVIRLRKGDLLTITNGQGLAWEVKIEHSDRKSCTTGNGSPLENQTNWPFELRLCIAPPRKPSRLEWLIEKITEIGVNHISLLQSRRMEKSHWSYDRLNRIMIAAMQQSGQFTLPRLDTAIVNIETLMQDLANISAGKYVATCDWGNLPTLSAVYTPTSHVIMLIGPEGDFDKDEIATLVSNGFQPVLFGNRRLRTETAAVVACAQIHTLYDKA